MCGGGSSAGVPFVRTLGRSPRVRGRHLAAVRLAIERRSIPACAGEAAIRLIRRHRDRVDPRVCGGGGSPRPDGGPCLGRSPRVRGRLPIYELQSAANRSIPACAGEACCMTSRSVMSKVDPRVCGGGTSGSNRKKSEAGRSPRVRGRHDDMAAENDRLRSIPACAGEARRRLRSTRSRKVDPRVCGGGVRLDIAGHIQQGRSPRVRGRRRLGEENKLRGGSIPACAGEADKWKHNAPARQVDPRVCGGGYVPAASAVAGKGRSPRVRGRQRAIDSRPT